MQLFNSNDSVRYAVAIIAMAIAVVIMLVIVLDHERRINKFRRADNDDLTKIRLSQQQRENQLMANLAEKQRKKEVNASIKSALASARQAEFIEVAPVAPEVADWRPEHPEDDLSWGIDP